MFRKKIKKEFPPGTFIPFPARVVVIIQLCLAFSWLFWQASQPFMGDLFRIRSQMLVYQDVMGINTQLRPEHQDRLERNAERFENLPPLLKNHLAKNYAFLQEKLKAPLIEKLQQLLFQFTYKMSSYELAWIFFSIMISILLLKRIEGARHATWLLSILSLLVFFDNQIQENPKYLRTKYPVFPSEHYIVQNYLKEPLHSNIMKQKEQLLQGWQIYLIKEWAHEIPQDNPHLFNNQVEKGEFMFNIARLEDPQQDFQSETSILLLYGYVLWNVFFAWYVNRELQAENYA